MWLLLFERLKNEKMNNLLPNSLRCGYGGLLLRFKLAIISQANVSR